MAILVTIWSKIRIYKSGLISEKNPYISNSLLLCSLSLRVILKSQILVLDKRIIDSNINRVGG